VHAASAKAAIDAMTKVLACEWGPHGIRVVGLVPGAIGGTEGMARLSDFGSVNNKEASKNSINDASKAQKAAQNTFSTVPCQRLGFVEDVSNAGLYLASPAASYCTGVNLVVDGGAFLTMPNHPFAMPEFVEAWRTAKL
jgi:peroxisomal 2,4-dienoyl-CoA reductase